MSSGVFERLRKTSGLKWLDEAEQLRKEVLIFATSKAIPKSWRFTFSAPMADSARKMVDYLVTAKEFYPNTEHKTARLPAVLQTLKAGLSGKNHVEH